MDDEDIKGLTTVLGIQAGILGLLVGLGEILGILDSPSPLFGHSGVFSFLTLNLLIILVLASLYIAIPISVLIHGLYTDTKSWKTYLGNLILSLAVPVAIYYIFYSFYERIIILRGLYQLIYASWFPIQIIFFSSPAILVLIYLYLTKNQEWWDKAMLMNLNVILLTIAILTASTSMAVGSYTGLSSVTEVETYGGSGIAEKEVRIPDLRCFNSKNGEETKGVIQVPFKNSGERPLDLEPIDMEISDFDTGSLNATLTRRNISLSSNDTSTGVDLPSGEHDFSLPRRTSFYNITLDKKLIAEKRYRVEFIFKDENSLTIGRHCQANIR